MPARPRADPEGRLIVLVSDSIYVKTRRFADKIRELVGPGTDLHLAIVDGFDPGLPAKATSEYAAKVMDGTIAKLADQIRLLEKERGRSATIVALNQSAILPGIALRRVLGRPYAGGHVEACDKVRTRELLDGDDALSVDYAEIPPSGAEVLVKVPTPESPRSDEESSNVLVEILPRRVPLTGQRPLALPCVVKPAFGMSSNNVRVGRTAEALRRAVGPKPDAKVWVPRHIMEALGTGGAVRATDTRIVESYIEGTEFSIDGWIFEGRAHAIVQHKLYMVERGFIGDGVTITPPLRSSQLPPGEQWRGLETPETEIVDFGLRVLEKIGFTRGVFHIEARERATDKKLCLIEVNPRSPGGALWRSAMLRAGYDCERVDAILQIGCPFALDHEPNTKSFVIHVPFYADQAGELRSWGEIEQSVLRARGWDWVEVYTATEIGTVFTEKSMEEEPYLAFIVAHGDSLEQILDRIHLILGLAPPEIG